MGAEESTATHVEVYPAVSRQPSISSGSHSGQEHMVISLLSLSFYFIFFGKKWKNYSVNAFFFSSNRYMIFGVLKILHLANSRTSKKEIQRRGGYII